MDEPVITDGQIATLQGIHDELRALADHPVPVVRAGVRQALAEVAQVLNAVGARYELYSKELAT